MLTFIELSMLDKSIKSVFLIALILLVRKQFNIKGIKWANMILWSILFIYLLTPYLPSIHIDNMEQYGWFQLLLQPMLWMSKITTIIAKQFGSTLTTLNRIVVTFFLICYVLYQIFKMNWTLMGSEIIEEDNRITQCLSLFRFRRKISFYTNDAIQMPITYGLIHPKIILTSDILRDDELLRHVLIHELTHIQKFDIVWNHLKYLVACLYWYNLLIIAVVKYIEEDLEMLCDKLVVQKIGDTATNRKQYCNSMLKLVEQETKESKLALALHPTMERMVVMKKWKATGTGMICLLVVMMLSIGAFADVNIIETDRVVSSVSPSKTYINEDNRVQVIDAAEYQELKSKSEIETGTSEIDISGKSKLSDFAVKQYQFDMNAAWKKSSHDGFVIDLSDISSSESIDYTIYIQEDGRVIYQDTLEDAATLTVKANSNGKYTVTIKNSFPASLKYTIHINSYIQ